MAEYIDIDAPIDVAIYRRNKRVQITIRQLLESNGVKYECSDVVERKKGKWQITDAYPHNVYCSECHKKFAQTHWAVWEDGSLPRNFCPNCGADMRGERDDRGQSQKSD